MCTGLSRTACPLRLFALCILLSHAAAYFGSAETFISSIFSELMEIASDCIIAVFHMESNNFKMRQQVEIFGDVGCPMRNYAYLVIGCMFNNHVAGCLLKIIK